MKTLHLTHEPKTDKEKSFWVLKEASTGEVLQIYVISKAEAVRKSVKYCKKLATKKNPISLMIHKKRGKFFEERTYPKSADPRRSKG